MSAPRPATRTSAGNRKVSLVLPAALAERLEGEATQRGVRLTTLLLEGLERGFPERSDPPAPLPPVPAAPPLAPVLEALERRLEAALEGRTRELVERLSPLFARSALEAATARYLTVQILGELLGLEAGQDLARAAYEKALSHLGTPSRGVRVLLGTLEDEVG